MARTGTVVVKEFEPERWLIEVEGIPPGLLTQNGEQYTPPEAGGRGQKDTRTDEQKFVESLYKLQPARDGAKYGIPARAFRGALVEAGKSKVTRISGAQAKRSFAIEGGPDGLLPLRIEGEPVIRKERGRNPNSRGGGKGAPIYIVRAHFPAWKCTVPVILNGTEITDTIHLFQVAGLVAGVGGFRPEVSGDFGKFRVTGVSQVIAKEANNGSDG